MADLYKYGVAVHLYKPIIKRAVVDFAIGADWSPAAGDVKISKDGGAAANVTNLPAAITMGNTAMWDYSLTATEMQAAKIRITVCDSATKAVEDQMFEIDTYGNAAAQHAIDFADAVRAGLTALPNANAEAAGGLLTRGAGAGQINQNANGQIDTRWVAGNVTVGTNNDKTGYGLSAAAVQAIWDALTSALTTVGSIGKLLVDKLTGLTFTVANQVDVNVVDWKGAAAPAMTGDAFARLGAPAGASVSADIAAAKTVVDAVKAQTDRLTFDAGNNIRSNMGFWGNVAVPVLGVPAGASVMADLAAVKTDTAAVKVQTDKMSFTLGGRISSNVAEWGTVVVPVLGAIVGASIMADIQAAKTLTVGERNAIADAHLDRADGVETGWTIRQSMRVITSTTAGKLSGAGTVTETMRNVTDVKARVTATVDASGNRSAITYDVT